VFLAEPPRTPYDLNFQVLGFPVRVHPLFWLVTLILGFSGPTKDLAIHLVIWTFAAFVSILIHELGHALMIRRFGRDAHIVLHWMGGLAIEGRPRGDYGSPWSFDSYTAFQPRARSPHEQILISAAGPGIQLLLAAIVVGAVLASGGQVQWDFDNIIPLPIPAWGGPLKGQYNFNLLTYYLLYVNIFWALVNLLPVLPLDGGQIAMQVLTQQDPWGGAQRALWLSVFVGGGMALVSYVVLKQSYTMMLFASLAFSSYLTLQQMGGRRPW
jgi:Zn-dependent protease